MKRLALALFLSAACSTPGDLEGVGRAPPSAASARSLAPPEKARGEHVAANWKERLAQPFVFLEHRGDYRRLGEVMRRLCAEAEALGLRPDGAPFALFFDDPGRVPLAELRARACWPVSEKPARLGALRYEVLPRAMVVYARVRGGTLDVARSYPALFSYLHQLGWQQGGPIREVYSRNPHEPGGGELVTEVQIPWSARAE